MNSILQVDWVTCIGALCTTYPNSVFTHSFALEGSPHLARVKSHPILRTGCLLWETFSDLFTKNDLFLFLTHIEFYLYLSFYFIFYHSWHVEVPRPGIQSELHLWPRWILKPRHKSRDQTCAARDNTRSLTHCTTGGTPHVLFTIVILWFSNNEIDSPAATC